MSKKAPETSNNTWWGINYANE